LSNSSLSVAIRLRMDRCLRRPAALHTAFWVIIDARVTLNE
jgi:hypothetical protein